MMKTFLFCALTCFIPQFLFAKSGEKTVRTLAQQPEWQVSFYDAAVITILPSASGSDAIEMQVIGFNMPMSQWGLQGDGKKKWNQLDILRFTLGTPATQALYQTCLLFLNDLRHANLKNASVTFKMDRQGNSNTYIVRSCDMGPAAG